MDLNWDEASVSVSQNESASVLKLRGAFSLPAARPLQEAALQIALSRPAKVVIECSEVEHLDGSAIQILLALKLGLEAAGGSLHLTEVSADVRKYLHWAGLSAHFSEPAGSGGTADNTTPRKRGRTGRKRTARGAPTGESNSVERS